MLKVQHPTNFILIYFLFTIFMWISLTVFCIYTFNKVNIIHKFNEITLNSTSTHNIDWNIIATAVHMSNFAETYVHYFQFSFAGLCIIVCRYMTLMLLRHIQITKYIIRSQNVSSSQCEACFFRFNNIMTLFRMADSVFS